MCLAHDKHLWRISWAQILFFEVAMEKKHDADRVHISVLPY